MRVVHVTDSANVPQEQQDLLGKLGKRLLQNCLKKGRFCGKKKTPICIRHESSDTLERVLVNRF